MTPEHAGKICDDLDKNLRSSEFNLSAVASRIVLVIREEAWRARVIRTGEIIKCRSFLELLTAPPLKGFGEDPKHVEALLKDDAEALRMFRAATIPPKHKHHTDTDNVSIKASHGNTRAYTLTRLHQKAPALYERVVAGELSAHAAAIRVGLRRSRTPLEQLRHWWQKASVREREAFIAGIEEG
jgi:hypothetical protein